MLFVDSLTSTSFQVVNVTSQLSSAVILLFSATERNTVVVFFFTPFYLLVPVARQCAIKWKKQLSHINKKHAADG